MLFVKPRPGLSLLGPGGAAQPGPGLARPRSGGGRGCKAYCVNNFYHEQLNIESGLIFQIDI